ncbi:MAG: nitronate monooxygenase, partial [Actinomycetota bacterium]|nr:nitronate monooxygenase [Actinomycetota bacterium]
MAGGPSTPALVDAVAAAGGLAFLAAGYRTPADVREQVRALTASAYGLNVFVPGPPGDPAAVAAYRAQLRPLAARLGVE